MSQSNRTVANALFMQALNARKEAGQTVFTPAESKAFRKNMVADIFEKTACTWNAACTHYAYALNRVKSSEPELIAGLGRAEGKNNGGRKKKVAEVAVAAVDEASALALLDFTPPAGASMVLETAEEVAPADAAEPAALLPQEEVQQEPQLVDVVRCKDGEIAAQGVSLEEAQALIDKAAAAKKGKLMIKQ